MADEDEFFANFEISPEDMKFSVTQPNGQIFDRMLNKKRRVYEKHCF